MDATTVQIPTKAYLAEISQRLDEARASPRRRKPVPRPAIPSGKIAIALDVEQLVSQVNTLLNATSLINRISKD